MSEMKSVFFDIIFFKTKTAQEYACTLFNCKSTTAFIAR